MPFPQQRPQRRRRRLVLLLLLSTTLARKETFPIASAFVVVLQTSSSTITATAIRQRSASVLPFRDGGVTPAKSVGSGASTMGGGNGGSSWHPSPPCRTGSRHGALHMATTTTEPDWSSADPWNVLGLPRGTSAKDVKRAYKRLALRYHPDVATTKDSPAALKKKASDQFAKINWAYTAITSGTSYESSTSSSSSKTAGSSTGSTTSTPGWQPPHRRNGPYTSSSSSSGSNSGSSSSDSTGFYSTDWRDYMPNTDGNSNDEYAADGDSFGKIFSDLVQGAAGVAATGAGGGVGIFRDFVDFLEQNVDGYSPQQRNNDDADLKVLLQTGNVNELGEEMDETELVVQQLSNKLTNVQNELFDVQADVALAARYMEKLELQERADELQARKKVVEGYLKKARHRLVVLQTRYKELIVQGQNDGFAGGRSTFNRENIYSSPSSSSRGPAPTETSTSRSSTTAPNAEDAWKEEGFGSFGRGRGSSRRRSQQQQPQQPTSAPGSSSATGSNPDTTSDRNEASRYESSSQSTATSRSSTARPSTASTLPNQQYVPPHRRSSFAQKQDDQRRLREIKVDEEFDKLKKDLGL